MLLLACLLQRTLDLFSGIGCFSYALSSIAKTVMYCDINPASQAVLTSNMNKNLLDMAPNPRPSPKGNNKNLRPPVPKGERGKKTCPLSPFLFWRGMGDEKDIRLLKPPANIELITAGAPCVGFSKAGKKEGFKDKQSVLFFEMIRLVKESNPKYVLLENVGEILDEIPTISLSPAKIKRGIVNTSPGGGSQLTLVRTLPRPQRGMGTTLVHSLSPPPKGEGVIYNPQTQLPSPLKGNRGRGWLALQRRKGDVFAEDLNYSLFWTTNYASPVPIPLWGRGMGVKLV